MIFVSSCAEVLSPTNLRFRPQLDQGPGLGYVNFSPPALISTACFILILLPFPMRPAFGTPAVLGCGLLDHDKSKVIRGGWEHWFLQLRGLSALHVSQKF